MGILSKIGAFVLSRDMYEQKINLRIASQTSIQTFCGGIVSILIYATIFAFTVTRFIKLAKRDDPFVYEVK
jgi:hypothetical protein